MSNKRLSRTFDCYEIVKGYGIYERWIEDGHRERGELLGYYRTKRAAVKALLEYDPTAKLDN